MDAWSMDATEDMCGVEIWKDESFEGLRSSREWKSLSLNHENFNQYAVVKAVPKSHRHIAMRGHCDYLTRAGCASKIQPYQALCAIEFNQLLVGVALHLISQPQPATDMQCQRIGIELQIPIFHLTCGFAKKLDPPLK
ncbi:hypothetical protein SAMN05216428_101540 [Nitrosospira sp. Nsp11]|nr:hypothetical protein SAMN05216428_101540 [Nitrosospira sp. Nsp11]